MENYAKREPKWEPKSIQNSKNMKKKACYKLYQHLIPKKSQKCVFGGHLGPRGCRREVRRASLRRRRFAMLASSIWNAWHRPVSADCSSGRPPTPWDPGCWSDYFYTRNWRTLVETGIQKTHAKLNAEKVVNINAKRFPKWGQNGCWNQWILKKEAPKHAKIVKIFPKWWPVSIQNQLKSR